MRAVLLCVAVARLAVNADSLDLKERPVSKVINLLKEMQVNLEKEKAADEELYEKLNCWCETNEKEKTGAVEEAQRRITALVADIEKHSGKSAQLTAEIAQLEKEIAANKAALETATSVREKEHADFNQNEKDMVQAIESLKNAVLVLEAPLVPADAEERLRRGARVGGPLAPEPGDQAGAAQGPRRDPAARRRGSVVRAPVGPDLRDSEPDEGGVREQLVGFAEGGDAGR
jgi:hypothetical protein